MMSNVKLAVRVRPFTDRELKSEKDRVPVIDVLDDNTVTITNVKVSLSGAGDSRERVRSYYVDYGFDSSCPVTLPSHATQEKVFKAMGHEVLASISRGCSACVVAYGQSATGKTHTMMGTEAQPGLVPRLCKALAKQNPCDITISFLEIYNERVHDLLVGDSSPPTCHSLPRRRGNARKDLRVREHPNKGPYVQNLRRVAVTSVEALLSLVAEGARRRRTAATKRNSTSSRSHALLEITTPTATLHLADLAGSEKASWEGCGGGRQKEGANINKSLVALSNVISALEGKNVVLVSGGSGRSKFVPYRDSALTWLLKDCFTGGACIFIIATVSPSVVSYGESASTLRWAARARQLPTPRPVSGSTVSSRAALQTQLTQLLAELARNHIQYIPETGKIFYDEHYWTLRSNIDQPGVKPDKAANIGNIMNILQTKTDVNNSESTASSVTSSSSDQVNTMDRNIAISNEINKEVNKIFSPALERTSSSSDLKVVAPLRHNRRQYKSQEVLPLDETIQSEKCYSFNTLPRQTEEQVNLGQNATKHRASHVPILHENQRAEIVASVTERLYSKLKKKEQAAVSKIESVVDKKIVEPLNELKICTNARQRLIDISRKALNQKRRIGIPAHTQTRISATRVKDQAIDVQTDLDWYILKNSQSHACRDVSTETTPVTPRYKEVAVGSKYGMIDLHDQSTITDKKKMIRKSSYTMTDTLASHERCTQTQIVPPPRRKKRATNSIKHTNNDNTLNCAEDCFVPSVIKINISQTYPVDSETQSSDDSSDNNWNQKNKNLCNATLTPDLLTNHNTADVIKNVEVVGKLNGQNIQRKVDILNRENDSGDFSDSEDYELPRVTANSPICGKQAEIKNMILGRNASLYPYNIVLSPPKERNTQRIVKFKDTKSNLLTSVDLQTGLVCEINTEKESLVAAGDISGNDDEYFENTNSDSTNSSKLETSSFVWSKGCTANRTRGCLKKNHTPVYKSNPRYKTAKARLCKEFVGLRNDLDESLCASSLTFEDIKGISSSESTEIDDKYQYKFRRRGNFSNDTPRGFEMFETMERKILDSCKDLETSVKKYEDYLTKIRDNKQSRGDAALPRTPTEYLQHLIKLRREFVKAEIDTPGSSCK